MLRENCERKPISPSANSSQVASNAERKSPQNDMFIIVNCNPSKLMKFRSYFIRLDHTVTVKISEEMWRSSIGYQWVVLTCHVLAQISKPHFCKFNRGTEIGFGVKSSSIIIKENGKIGYTSCYYQDIWISFPRLHTLLRVGVLSSMTLSSNALSSKKHWSNGTLVEWIIGRMDHWSNGTFVERNIRRT